VFGLGWLELLVIGGGIMLVAGPAGVRKVAQTVQSAHKMKSDLTGPGALKRLLLDDRPASTDTDDEDEPGA